MQGNKQGTRHDQQHGKENQKGIKEEAETNQRGRTENRMKSHGCARDRHCLPVIMLAAGIAMGVYPLPVLALSRTPNAVSVDHTHLIARNLPCNIYFGILGHSGAIFVLNVHPFVILSHGHSWLCMGYSHAAHPYTW